jgi:diguanylate cyclase (GGDEF)-like protein
VKASIKKFNVAMVIEFLYLLLAGLVIIYMFKQVLRADREKNTQMALLVSMSDIYNSMHLIDLDKDTVVEYNARAELSEVVNNTCGANETLKQMITLTTEDEYREAALAFTDMYTIADRMKNRKIISGEFMSKVIGWYRASLITIETDYAGHPVKLIYVTQNIDKEKKEVEELIQKSNADELTGLYNRRAYEEDIAEYDHKGIVDSFVFVSLDVNGLKTVNDNLGHVAGDELLIGAANCIEECFGQYGKIYRIGGDEFVAMISVNEIQLQVIKRNFEDTTAKWSGNLVDSLSVSCGYVTKMEAGNISMHEMANIADKRMYEAKNRFYENNTRRRRRIR